VSCLSAGHLILTYLFALCERADVWFSQRLCIIDWLECEASNVRIRLFNSTDSSQYISMSMCFRNTAIDWLNWPKTGQTDVTGAIDPKIRSVPVTTG